MNRLTIIGNLTRDPETRTTQSGKNVCTFSVAVNRRGEGVDYFRVNAWGKTGEVCQQYLAKGRKVAVVGPVSVSSYTTQDGKAHASMDIMAQDVEFLSSKELYVYKPAPDTPHEEYTQVDDEDLPF